MRTLSQDLRFAFRLFRNNPGFTAVAVFTLALGIAANTTVFGWIDGVVLNPFPGAGDPQELAMLETVTTNGEVLVNTSFLDYKDYRDHLKLVSGLAVSRFTPTQFGEEGKSEKVFAELVSRNFFEVLRVQPALGRAFRSSECSDEPETCALAVVSHKFWKTRLNADSAIAGKSIRIGRRQFTVVGVAPPEFRGGFAGLTFDLWVPINWAKALGTGNGTLTFRGTRDLTSTFARLKPGVSIAQARQEVVGIATRLAEAHPSTNTGINANLVPVYQAHNGAQVLLHGPLRILMAVCFVMLLIVCANVANLLLARMISRQKEFTIRLALGSGPARLVRQVLTETLLLAIFGSIVGVILSQWMGQAIVYILPPVDAPIAFSQSAALRTLIFTVLAGIAATVIAGIAPALLCARINLNEVLKQGGRTGAASQSNRLRALLVVAEVALASVAIIGAGLFVRSFQNATAIHPGFDHDNILVGQYALSPAGYTAEQQRDFCVRLRQRLEATPGIAGVSYSDVIPLSFGSSPYHQLTVEGYAPAPGEDMHLHRSLVPPGHFNFLKIKLLEGRDFTEADNAKSAPVMIVNETFVRRYYHDRQALGAKVRQDNTERIIVGIVKDSKYHNPLEAPIPYFYVPFKQMFAPGLNFTVFVKTQGDPILALAALRRESLNLNRDATVYSPTTLTEAITASLYPQKVAASFLTVLGAVSLLLASIGLYSVMSFAVSSRTSEIGLRMALGARPANVILMVVKQGLILTLPGLAAGIAAGLVLSRLISAFLVKVGTADPLTYLGAASFLAACAILACFFPALRATRVSPTTALRSE